MDTNLSIPHNSYAGFKTAGAIAAKQQSQETKKVSEPRDNAGAKLDTNQHRAQQTPEKKTVETKKEPKVSAREEPKKQSDFELRKPETKKENSFSPENGIVYKETHAKLDDIVYVQIPNEQQLRAREQYAKTTEKRHDETIKAEESNNTTHESHT